MFNSLAMLVTKIVKAIEAMNLEILSTEESIYWPSDNKKILDLLDFGIIKGSPKSYCHIESCLELFSGYSPIIFIINIKIILKVNYVLSATSKENGPISRNYCG